MLKFTIEVEATKIMVPDDDYEFRRDLVRLGIKVDPEGPHPQSLKPAELLALLKYLKIPGEDDYVSVVVEPIQSLWDQ